ncbi:MAG: GNAT family N-acetyltransferase [Alphaproteobacteria bacterium]
MKTPILKTPRLILRPITIDDAPEVQKNFNNWNIIKYVTAPWPYPDDGARTQIQDVLSEVQKGNQLSWVIILKSTKEFIGRIDYCRLAEKNPKRGFWLAEPFQGKGFMTEAVCITQDYMFNQCGLEKITVRNLKGNVSSRRVKEKTGARFIGNKTEIVRGKEFKCDVWEVTKESWEEAKGRLSF